MSDLKSNGNALHLRRYSVRVSYVEENKCTGVARVEATSPEEALKLLVHSGRDLIRETGCYTESTYNIEPAAGLTMFYDTENKTEPFQTVNYVDPVDVKSLWDSFSAQQDKGSLYPEKTHEEKCDEEGCWCNEEDGG